MLIQGWRGCHFRFGALPLPWKMVDPTGFRRQLRRKVSQPQNTRSDVTWSTRFGPVLVRPRQNHLRPSLAISGVKSRCSLPAKSVTEASPAAAASHHVIVSSSFRTASLHAGRNFHVGCNHLISGVVRHRRIGLRYRRRSSTSLFLHIFHVAWLFLTFTSNNGSRLQQGFVFIRRTALHVQQTIIWNTNMIHIIGQ